MRNKLPNHTEINSHRQARNLERDSVTFKYIELTGLAPEAILHMAQAHVAACPHPVSLQDAVDTVIDAAIERAQ